MIVQSDTLRRKTAAVFERVDANAPECRGGENAAQHSIRIRYAGAQAGLGPPRAGYGRQLYFIYFNYNYS